MSLRVASVNVNGIRAAFRKGMDRWVAGTTADVILAQEVRAPADVAAALFGEEWQVEVLPSQLKGRAGVAVAWRKDVLSAGEVNGTAVAEVDPSDSGRWLEVALTTGGGTTVRAISAYLHSGQVDTPKLDAKLSHLQRVTERLDQLASDPIPTLVCGDFNVVRTHKDIKNWKGNHNKTSGVLDVEIAYLDRWMNGEWVDVSRHLNGDAQGPYTWWSWRGKAFDNDAGWRIDYHMASPVLAELARDVTVDKAASYDERFSDHAPLLATYDIA